MKKSARKSAPPRPKPGVAGKNKPGTPAGPKAGKSETKTSKPLQMSPIARHILENARKRSPIDAARPTKLSRGEVDAIRQLAIALAENELGTDEDLVMNCNRITEPPAVPLADLLYDTCRWCEAEIYYDRLMPSPPDLVRVCMPCGIMLLDAEKKGRN
jgi:hypothetical protein